MPASQSRHGSQRLPVAYNAVLILLTITTAYCVGPTARAGEPNELVTIIPDTGASLAEVALHYDPDLRDRLSVFYGSLFAALPPDVRIQVICPHELAVQEFQHQWGSPEQKRGRVVRVVSMDRPITIWARDRRIARHFPTTGQPGPTLISTRTDRSFEHAWNDLSLADRLRSLGMVSTIVKTTLYVEGGNVVSNDHDAFVGVNVLAQNPGPDYDDASTEMALRAQLGRPVIFVGQDGGRVPWSHVDYYLTPIDDSSVLVAGSVASYTLQSTEPEVSRLLSRALSKRDARGNAKVWAQDLDAVAEQLTRHNYQVNRLPMLRDPDGVWAVSYNNVLMERRDTRRIVYMPTYRIPALDQAAATIYRNLGFEVRSIDVSTMFRFGGAVRCLVNVLERRPPGPNGPATPGSGDRR